VTDLDPEISAMLRREGARVDVPPDAAARVTAKLAASIAAGAGPAPSSDGAGGAGGSAGAGAGVVKLVPFLITFVVGAGFGAAGMAARKGDPRSADVHETSAPSASVAQSPRVMPSAPATASAGASPASAPSMPTIAVDALPSARGAPPPSSTSSTSNTTSTSGSSGAVRVVADSAAAAGEDAFVAERRVLDAARRALVRGDHAEALRALEEHARTYPKGKLAEEREALLVRTLADHGQIEDARAAAARFRTRWPGSVLLPAVEAAAGRP
jgi:TolA-binding protein